MTSKHKPANENILPMWEQLERRDLFSGNTLALQPAAAPTAQPAALIAEAAKKPPKVSAIVSVAGTGLTGEYFSDSGFTNAMLLRTDATVNLAPAQARKDPAILAAHSIRWTGQISPTYSESYSFSVVANGGIRLWVNGQLLIDQAQAKGGNLASASKISLVAGQKYSIVLEYTRQTTAAASVKLNWGSLHQKLGLIPQKASYPDTTTSLPAVSGGLIGQYYIGPDFNQLVMQRVDTTINFSFQSKAPSFLIPAGSPYSVRWTGQIVPAYSETYTFSTLSDDGVRLYVDDQLLINDFTDHSPKTDTAQITLVAGQAYDIRMDYYEDRGTATAKLMWASPSQPQEIVPASAFTSTPPSSAGTLTATVTSATSIHLSWTGSNTATGYDVEQSVDGGATYQTIQTTAENVTECDVIGLSADSNYMFRVAPFGSQDTSIASNPATGSTSTTSPGSITATPASSSSVNVGWTDVPGENGFVLYQAPAGSSTQAQSLHTQSLVVSDDDTSDFVPIYTAPAGVTSYLVEGLSPGQSYQFAVAAIDANGLLSALSNAATGTTPTDAPGSISSMTSTPGSVVINWVDVAGETGFAIDRSPDGTDNWQQIATTLQGVTTYTDTTVVPGTNYFYRVRGLDSAGSSDASSPVSVVTAVDAPAGLITSLITAAGTVLNWNDVANENGFAVLESTDGGATFSQVSVTATGVTTAVISGLSNATGYQFEIEAFNSAAMASTAGTPISIVTLPAAPATLTATAVSTTTASIVWTNVSGETGFVLERSTDGVTGWTGLATLPTGTLTYTDSTLSAGMSYFYRVSALNNTGSSSPSVVASALTIPSAPLASVAGLSVSQSQVSWAAVSGASQYVVQRSLDGATNWTTAATVDGSSLSAAVANLNASTAYYYRVAAVNATGSSVQSATVSQISAPLAQYAIHSQVYGTTSSGGIYAVDLVNGTSNWIGQLPVTPRGAVRDPISGVMYFYQQGTSNIYVWNPATGNTNLVDTSFIPVPTVTGAYLPDGTSYIVGSDGSLFKGASGTLSVTTIGTLKVAGTPLATTPTSMSFSPNGVLYMTAGANIYTVNTTTAAVTPLATTLVGNVLAVFGPKGIMYMTSPTGALYSFNLTTLVQTLVGNDNLPSFTSLAADAVFTHLAISATASPTVFNKGQNATYAVQVTNTTGDDSTQPVTVATTLPTGLTYVSVSGAGWTAAANGQSVTFTYTGDTSANGSLPALDVTVAVSSSAPASVTTQFSATGGDLDANPLPAPAIVVSVVS